MRIVVAAVGRLKKGPETELSERYRKRTAQTGRALGLRDVEIIEIRESRADDPAKRMIEESIALANVIPQGAAVVLLDARGDNVDSASLAGKLAKWRGDDRPAVVFLIGGADGLAASLHEKAELRLSFGAATWPHQLVRVMLLEQLYRATTILTGHPYHRGLIGLNPDAMNPDQNILVAITSGRNLDLMICFGGHNRLNPRFALMAGLGFILPVALGLVAPARAQQPAAQNDKAVKLDALKQHDEELKAARERQRKSADNEAALKREIEEIGADRRKLNQALIDTAARTRAVEAKVAATQTRLKPLDEKEQGIRKSLDGRRAVIGEVLAALQRIGHRPPPALMSSPEDALQAVRTAMLLGAVLPEMRHEVDALAGDLKDLLNVRKSDRYRARPAQSRGRFARQ